MNQNNAKDYMKHHEETSCIAALEAMEKHRRHVAITHLVGAIIRNLGWFALGALLTFAAVKSHAQQFTPPDHQLPPDAIHLSPADTSPGADPKRGLDNLPEATEERYMAFGGILFVSVYFWANWLDRRNKRKI